MRRSRFNEEQTQEEQTQEEAPADEMIHADVPR